MKTTASPVLKVPLMGQLISRGDGSFVLKPTMQGDPASQWLSIREAAELLGVSPKSVYRLAENYLVVRRPVPRRIMVSLASVLRLKQATGDTEFWTDRKRQEAFRAVVLQEMEKQIDNALLAGK